MNLHFVWVTEKKPKNSKMSPDVQKCLQRDVLPEAPAEGRRAATLQGPAAPRPAQDKLAAVDFFLVLLAALNLSGSGGT